MDDNARRLQLTQLLANGPVHKKKLFGPLGFASAQEFNKWAYRANLKNYGISDDGKANWSYTPQASMGATLRGLGLVAYVATPVEAGVPSPSSTASSSSSEPSSLLKPESSRGGAEPSSANPQKQPSSSASLFAPTRKALLIGNSQYASADYDNVLGPTDAIDLSTILAQFGFAHANRLNQTGNEIQTLVDQFFDAVTEQDHALFYFSGLGGQLEKEGLLIYGTDDVPFMMEELMQKQTKRSGILIVILDCCPTNLGSRKSTAEPTLPPRPFCVSVPRNAFIMFSSTPQHSGHSYTWHLMETLKSAVVLSIESLAKHVRTNLVLEQSTDGTKVNVVTWDASCLIDDFEFNANWP